MEEKKMDTAPQLSLDTQEVPTLTLDLETAVEQPLAPKPEQPFLTKAPCLMQRGKWSTILPRKFRLAIPT